MSSSHRGHNNAVQGPSLSYGLASSNRPVIHDRSRDAPLSYNPSPPHHLPDDDYYHNNDNDDHMNVSQSSEKKKSRRGRGAAGRRNSTSKDSTNHSHYKNNHHANHPTSYQSIGRNSNNVMTVASQATTSVMRLSAPISSSMVTMISPLAGAPMGGGVIGASGNRIPPVSTWSVEDWPIGQRVYRKADPAIGHDQRIVAGPRGPQCGRILDVKFVQKQNEGSPGRLRLYIHWDTYTQIAEALPHSLILLPPDIDRPKVGDRAISWRVPGRDARQHNSNHMPYGSTNSGGTGRQAFGSSRSNSSSNNSSSSSSRNDSGNSSPNVPSSPQIVSQVGQQNVIPLLPFASDPVIASPLSSGGNSPVGSRGMMFESRSSSSSSSSSSGGSPHHVCSYASYAALNPSVPVHPERSCEEKTMRARKRAHNGKLNTIQGCMDAGFLSGARVVMNKDEHRDMQPGVGVVSHLGEHEGKKVRVFVWWPSEHHINQHGRPHDNRANHGDIQPMSPVTLDIFEPAPPMRYSQQIKQQVEHMQQVLPIMMPQHPPSRDHDHDYDERVYQHDARDYGRRQYDDDRTRDHINYDHHHGTSPTGGWMAPRSSSASLPVHCSQGNHHGHGGVSKMMPSYEAKTFVPHSGHGHVYDGQQQVSSLSHASSISSGMMRSVRDGNYGTHHGHHGASHGHNNNNNNNNNNNTGHAGVGHHGSTGTGRTHSTIAPIAAPKPHSPRTSVVNLGPSILIGGPSLLPPHNGSNMATQSTRNEVRSADTRVDMVLWAANCAAYQQVFADEVPGHGTMAAPAQARGAGYGSRAPTPSHQYQRRY